MIIQIDPHPLITAHLLTISEVTALVGSGSAARIWQGEDTPPMGYEPTQGAAIVFRVRGGTEDHSPHYARPSIQFKCYGPTRAAAYSLALTAKAALDNAPISGLPTGNPEGIPNLINETNGWPMAVFFYQFLAVSPAT